MPRTTWRLLELCQITDVPVSKGSEQPVSAPLRTAEDTHGPEGMGYAELPSTGGQLTAHDAAEAWVRPHMPTPVNWSGWPPAR